MTDTSSSAAALTAPSCARNWTAALRIMRKEDLQSARRSHDRDRQSARRNEGGDRQPRADLIKWMIGLMLGSVTTAVAIAVAVDRFAG